MKKISLTTSFIFLCLSIFSQINFNYLFNNNEGKNYYKNGILLLQSEEYSKADSLFSLALCTFKNEDVYFNRGISRLLRFDTIGFCEDFNIAANKYFDKEAQKLFTDYCCNSVDTIYYDKKYIETTKNKHRYYEEIRNIKYKPKTIGIIHDNKTKVERFNIDFGCENSILGMETIMTDIIGVYELKDSIKYFKYTTKSPIIYNSNTYSQAKEKAKKYFSIKYSALKKEYGYDKLAIYYYIYISETGKIVDYKYLNIFPKINEPFSKQEIEKEILSVINLYPKIKPGKFLKKKVRTIVIDYIEF